MDLIGIPHRLVIGDKGLAKGVAEYKDRRDATPREIALGDVANEIGRLVRGQGNSSSMPRRLAAPDTAGLHRYQRMPGSRACLPAPLPAPACSTTGRESMNNNINAAMRFFFLVVGSVVLLGIWLTGFNTAHWLLYVPVVFFYFAAATGICPGLIFSGMLFPAKAATKARHKKR